MSSTRIGPARSEDITFYRNRDGTPGKIVRAFNEVIGTADGPGGFVITLPEALRLGPGKYWVSVQANMNFVDHGEWYWQTRTIHRGRKGV